MPLTLRARGLRVAASLGLAAALLAPAAAPTAAADPVVLRVGTVQDNDSLNPYATLLVVGYEAFQLSYNLITDFGNDLEPVPGFAESWERAPDRVTFKIREGMKWSDGEPATAEDACFSWQLGLDAIAANDGTAGYLGAGFLDPGLLDAGVTRVECPDATTMIAYTTDQSDRIYQSYMPIIPKHIWGDETWETIGEAAFDAPLVGTGPYTAAEWQTGEFIRFERNPNYWGTQGFADQVVIQFFGNADTMVQALKAGEIDYARGVNADQLKALESDPGIQTVVGAANGWTQLAFNSYGSGTGKTIPDGGPSTQALVDPAFRDALGYAIDKPLLVERILGGYGDVGTTIIPPVLSQWHVEPTSPRTFDIELAKQKLDAAGYVLDASGARLDKEGKPISLDLVYPNTDDVYAKSAQFVVEWYGELGIKTTATAYDQGTLGELVLPPEAGEGYTADYDIELWGWSGSPDPNALLQIFRCDAIGSSSDSQWCDPDYDQMYDDETAAATADARKAILAEMQNLVYDQAVYDILFYDSDLHAYRTDVFAGWKKMPSANGTPLFTYGTLNYTALTDATAQASPEPSPSAGASAGASATPAPSGDGGSGTGGGGDNTLLIVGLVAAAAVVVVGLVLFSRRRSAGTGEEE